MSYDESKFSIRLFSHEDVDALCEYFSELSDQTKRFFGPHAFDRETILNKVCNGNRWE